MATRLDAALGAGAWPGARRIRLRPPRRPRSFAGLLRHIAVCLLYVLLAALAYDVLHAAGVVKPEVHAAVLESLSVGRDWAAKGWAETSRGAW